MAAQVQFYIPVHNDIAGRNLSVSLLDREQFADLEKEVTLNRWARYKAG